MASYYVDPSIAANSGTGTIGDPYGDLQYALDSITQGASGDQINIKAGTAELLTGEISVATYGTPNVTKPLVFRGYTSSENDGGRGQISGNGGNFELWNKPTVEGIWFIDLILGDNTTNTGYVARIDRACGFVNCRFQNPGNSVLLLSTSTAYVINCEFIAGTSKNSAVYASALSLVYGCYFEDFGATTAAINGSADSCIFNRVNKGIDVAAYYGYAKNCSFYGNGSVANSYAVNASWGATVLNCYAENFTNASSIAFRNDGTTLSGLLSNNRWYNCTTGKSGTWLIESNNSSLGSSGFVDAASDDFSPTVDLSAIGIPQSQASHSTVWNTVVGAAQYVASAGGGQVFHPLGFGG